MPVSMRGWMRLPLPQRALAAVVAVALTGGVASVPLVRGHGTDLPVVRPGSAGDRGLHALPRFEDAEPPPGSPSPAPLAAAAPPVHGPAVPRVARPVPTAGTSLEQRGREALDSLRYPWPELGYTIRFQPYSGGLLGLADASTETITIFVKQRQTSQSLRHTIAHELGHALDHRTGDEAQRARYLELRGIPPGTPWLPSDSREDSASPAGDFAETFAVWLVGRGHFRSRIAPEPDDGQLRELAPLFAPPSARTSRSASPRPAPSPTPSPTPNPGLLDVLPGTVQRSPDSGWPAGRTDDHPRTLALG